MIQVIVPAYNCMEWLPKCLASIAIQRDVDFNVAVIDDFSTDLTQARFIEETCRVRGWNPFLNSERMKCPYNIWNAINWSGLQDEDIIFIVDGDDWLPDQFTLKKLESYYIEDPSLVMTYGSYISDPDILGPHPAEPYPDWVIGSNIYRYFTTNYNHPLTFKYKLWKNIDREDLQDENGNWYEAAYDECIMYPLLESAGNNFRFIEDYLYVYNASNPISESKTIQDVSMFTTESLRRKQVKGGLHLGDLVRAPETVYYVISKVNQAQFHLDVEFPETYRNDIIRHLDNADLKYEISFSDTMLNIQRKEPL